MANLPEPDFGEPPKRAAAKPPRKKVSSMALKASSINPTGPVCSITKRLELLNTLQGDLLREIHDLGVALDPVLTPTKPEADTPAFMMEGETTPLAEVLTNYCYRTAVAIRNVQRLRERLQLDTAFFGDRPADEPRYG